MSNRYLISLKPVGKFFFGGDMSFTVNGKKSEYSSYIIKSNKFPQQTSLLGMLRFLVLCNDSSVFDAATQSITDRHAAAKLIGESSFVQSGCKTTYGVINGISECFLQTMHNNQWTDLSFQYKADELQLDLNSGVIAQINGKSVTIPSMKYDSKEGLGSCYVGVDGISKIDEDIFVEDLCNGIDRNITTGKTDNNALFKQIFYRFKTTDFRFAFEADVDMDITPYNGQIVSVGADNSQFVIGIEKSERKSASDANGKCVVLLSPSYITETDLGSVTFAISDTIPFKSMKTRTESIGPYNKKSEKYDYSDKVMLYTTGSQFYFKSNEEAKLFASKIRNQSDFNQIGYNQCVIK